MPCQAAPVSLIEGLAEGLLGAGLRLQTARAVPVDPNRRDDRGWPVLIVAARIVGDDVAPGGVVAAWATGSTGGPIVALNAVAREFTDWGTASGGSSSTADVRDRIAAGPEVYEALRCAEAGLNIA